jgi:DnaJ-class molecular chaperone
LIGTFIISTLFGRRAMLSEMFRRDDDDACLYTIFNLDQTSSINDIDRAYDRERTDATNDASKLDKLKKAYSILSDAAKRKTYHEWLDQRKAFRATCDKQFQAYQRAYPSLVEMEVYVDIRDVFTGRERMPIDLQNRNLVTTCDTSAFGQVNDEYEGLAIVPPLPTSQKSKSNPINMERKRRLLTRPCPTCLGGGSSSSSSSSQPTFGRPVCTKCNALGYRIDIPSIHIQSWTSTCSKCDACFGMGFTRIVDDSCVTCNGHGLIQTSNVTIDILKSAQTLRAYPFDEGGHVRWVVDRVDRERHIVLVRMKWGRLSLKYDIVDLVSDPLDDYEQEEDSDASDNDDDDDDKKKDEKPPKPTSIDVIIGGESKQPSFSMWRQGDVCIHVFITWYESMVGFVRRVPMIDGQIMTIHSERRRVYEDGSFTRIDHHGMVRTLDVLLDRKNDDDDDKVEPATTTTTQHPRANAYIEWKVIHHPTHLLSDDDILLVRIGLELHTTLDATKLDDDTHRFATILDEYNNDDRDILWRRNPYYRAITAYHLNDEYKKTSVDTIHPNVSESELGSMGLCGGLGLRMCSIQ